MDVFQVYGKSLSHVLRLPVFTSYNANYRPLPDRKQATSGCPRALEFLCSMWMLCWWGGFDDIPGFRVDYCSKCCLATKWIGRWVKMNYSVSVMTCCNFIDWWIQFYHAVRRRLLKPRNSPRVYTLAFVHRAWFQESMAVALLWSAGGGGSR